MIIAIVEAPMVPCGLEYLRSSLMRSRTLFIARNIVDYAPIDTDGLLGHIAEADVLEVDTHSSRSIDEAVLVWQNQTGETIDVLITHSAEHAKAVANANASLGLRGLWSQDRAACHADLFQLTDPEYQASCKPRKRNYLA